MNTIGATTVFSGRDNSGEAAIVDSTYDNSFTQNLLTQISQDAIRKQQKKDKDLADRKKAMSDMAYQFDPLGVEELDNEMMQAVDAYENWLTEQQAAGANPSDPTTEAGKEALRMKRNLDMRNITGKTAAKNYQLAVAAGEEEGVDVAANTAWLEGYRAAKPTKEGETMAQAKARYVDANPNYAKRATGLFDFVTPIADKVEYSINSNGDKSIDMKKTAELLNMHLLTPQGQQLFKAMRPDGKVDEFMADQLSLFQQMKPNQKGKRTASSSSSSTKGGDKLDYSYRVTRSNHPEMWKADDSSVNNGILLSNKSGGQLPVQDINLPDDTVIRAKPISITKNKQGELLLEYTYQKGTDNNAKSDKGYIPYDLFRDRIMEMYGEDISQYMDGPATDSGSAMSEAEYQKFLEDNGIK
jgi:hypothetical protein